jgi:hypothetical protein
MLLGLAVLGRGAPSAWIRQLDSRAIEPLDRSERDLQESR